jgi:hypothetical protein
MVCSGSLDGRSALYEDGQSTVETGAHMELSIARCFLRLSPGYAIEHVLKLCFKSSGNCVYMFVAYCEAGVASEPQWSRDRK